MGFYYLIPLLQPEDHIPSGWYLCEIKSGDTFCITAFLHCIVLFLVGIVYLKLIRKLTQQA